METGTVKFFTVNEHGGYGFIELSSGKTLYFQRNDGGPVNATGDKPTVETWRRVRQPQKGDRINFERSSNNKGPKAAPWCFHEDWNQALVEIATRPTYRLMAQKGHRVRGKEPARQVWQGKKIAEVGSYYQGEICVGTKHQGDGWTTLWFERKTTDTEWERVEGDPRFAERVAC